MKQCRQCQGDFEPKKYNHVFCKKACTSKWHERLRAHKEHLCPKCKLIMVTGPTHQRCYSCKSQDDMERRTTVKELKAYILKMEAEFRKEIETLKRRMK